MAKRFEWKHGDPSFDMRDPDPTNPVLAGGRIMRPWKSKADVPPGVWHGNKQWNSKSTDEELLAKLNREYYHYWVGRDEARKREKKMAKLNGMDTSGHSAPCANVRCDDTVKIQRDEIDRSFLPGSRLCTRCRDLIRSEGEVDQGHGWKIVYVEEASE